MATKKQLSKAAKIQVTAAATTSVAPPTTPIMETAAPTTAAPIQPRITYSYRLFALLKKQKGIATTEELAAAAGLKPMYVSWYMAELKRVYGANYEHSRGSPLWTMKNLDRLNVPPGGVAGQRRGQSAQPVKKASSMAAEQTDLEQALSAAYQVVLSAINREFERLQANLAKAKGAEEIVGVPMSIWQQMKKQARVGATTPRPVSLN